MTAQEKLELDLRDFWRIHDGIAVYAKLSVEEFRTRIETHREDLFCDVINYAGNGPLQCTRDAHNAIVSLAERLCDSMPVPEDYSVEELVEGIRKHVVRSIVEEKQDEPALSRMLSDAVSEAEKLHLECTHHFPCVIVPYEEPAQFRIGIVTFTSAKAFPETFGPYIQRYLQANSNTEYGTRRVEKFRKFLAKDI